MNKNNSNISSTFERFGISLSSSFELKEILSKTCQTAVELFNVDHSGLVLFNQEFKDARVEAEYPNWNLIGKLIPIRGVPDEEKLINTRKPVTVWDVANQKSLGPIRPILLDQGIKSILLMPVISEGKLLGSFSLDVTKAYRRFTTQEKKYCELLAEQVSAAIENSMLYSKLLRTSSHLEELVSVSLDAVVSIDHNKHITIFNKQSERLLGYSASDVRGQTIVNLYHDINDAKKIWKKVHQRGSVTKHEVTLKHKNGTRIPILLSAISIKDASGKEVGQAGFMHTRIVEDRLQALIQASQAVGKDTNIDSVLQHIIESAIGAFPAADKGVIHLYNEKTGMLHIRANVGYRQDVIELVTFRSGEGRAGWVFKNGTPLVVGNIPKDKRIKKVSRSVSHPEVREQKSTICIPLKGRENKIIGTLSLDSVTAVEAFKSDDIYLLSIFADQVSVAIENAQLFEQTQRDLRIVGSFYGTSNRLDPTQDPNKSLKLLAANVKETIGALSVSITALDTSGRPFEKAHTGYKEKERVVRREGLSSIVMKSGKPYIIPDVDQEIDKVNPGMIKSGVKAALCLPLQSQGRSAGVMWVTYDQTHYFDVSEINLLGLLANQAGAFIETSRLFQERQILLETSRMVSLAKDLDQSLQTLAQMMVRSLGATFCRISILDDTRKILTTRAAFPVIKDLSWNPEIGKQYLADDALAEVKAIKTGRSQILNSDKNPTVLLSLGHRVGFLDELKSAVLIPLSLGKTVFGVITLCERRNRERGSFTLERVELCHTMADQVAGLIARMRLQEQSELNFRNLKRLYDASSKIGSTKDPDKTLKFIVSKACQAVDGWRATAVLLDDNKKPHRLATVSFDKELDAATSIRANGISMEVVKTGIPRVIEDVEKFAGNLNPAMLEDGVRAAICLPLRLREENIGVLWIHYKHPHRFSSSQIEALKLYSVQAAIAYDNVRRMRELKQLRIAIDAIVSLNDPKKVLQKIADSILTVLGADYTVIWSYDHIRDVFIPEELVATNVPSKWLKKFKENEPDAGKTTRRILQEKYIEVENLLKDPPDFIGKQTYTYLKGLGVNSFQGIRLDVAGDALGVLYVDYKRREGFGIEEKRLLEYLANNAALALKRVRLLDQVNKARNAAAVVSQIVALGKDEQRGWGAIVSGAKDALRCDAVTLYRYDEDSGELGYPPTVIGVKYPKKVYRFPKVPEESIVWKTLHSKIPIIIDDTSTDLFTKDRRFTIEEGIKSLVAIPLHAGNRKVGAMFINYRNQHRFVEDELINIRLFANQAAVAIRNTQMHLEIQQRLETLESLHEAGRVITSSFTLNETLDRIAEQAFNIVKANYRQAGCFSYITLLEGNRLNFVAAYPPKMLDYLQNKVEIMLNSRAKKGVVGKVFKKIQSENLGDVSKESQYIRAYQRTKSQLSVPINIGKHVIGVLSVEHPRHNAFSSEDVLNIELLAAQAAVAIQNIRRYEELEKTKDSLAAKSSLAWIGMASSTWGHGVEKIALTIREEVDLIRYDSKKKIPARLAPRLEKIENLANRVLEKPITPPLSEEEGVSSVSINEFILDRVEALKEHPEYQQVSITCNPKASDKSTVRVSLEWLRRAFDIIMDNAVEATKGLETRLIIIETKEQKGKIVLSVRDNGIGIPGNILKILFKEPIPKAKGEKGWGMGLLFAQMILQTYEGEIKCGDSSPSGTVIIMTLPIENGAIATREVLVI